jgi:dihydrofolate reductase
MSGNATRYTWLMRKIIGNLFMAIDGVVESPEKWSLSYWNDDIANVVMGGMQAADALLLGRVTYEEFAEAWSDRTVEDDPGADFMNNVKKYVVSRTLTNVDWNNSTLLEGELADSVRELKASDGGEIAMSGSSTLVRSLLNLRLLDELNLLVYPVIVGRGKRLAEGDGDQLPLELIKSTAFDNGVIHQLYRPAS